MAEKEILLSEDTKITARTFIARVYGWMALALVISGFFALYTSSSDFMFNIVWGTKYGIYFFLILELALVFILSASIQKMSKGIATFFFFLYSIINGITLSVIFLVFDINSIGLVFFISAAMFGAMAIYGHKTTQDLTSAGRYLTMALIGLIIASIANFLFRSSMLDWIISLVSVVVFIGLTAYDSQKMMKTAQISDESDTFKKAAIIGALELYLDFINIFLNLLSLFGKRRK